ncbi:energy transducer TonB [Sphingomonas sp. A2-49]|uniref:energy transducer TonB n=1 Tax=Sphingomonas sp. A2-49 TaxID=1391375 RepID=UPI0021D22254|nr:energy transducer TonB [Sphingomonas sp. A2-49]MCU6452508.1 energy transducer TonB [Sphingomonas sp. A2-49]
MLVIVAAALAAPQAVPPPIIAVPSVPRAPVPGQWLLHWTMSPVLCRDSRAQPSVMAPEPRRAVLYSNGNGRASATFDFRIDASGRPLSIRRRSNAYLQDSEDLAPALAATRFAPGGERKDCVVTFTPDVSPVAGASLHDVMATFMTPRSNPPRSVWDRIHAGGDCGDTRPAPLLRGYPDFKALPDQPGYASWTLIGFDLSTGGKPRAIRTLDGSGTAPLDRAGREAVTRSRFEKGAHRGCTYGYFKAASVLPAPPAPDEDAWRPTAATCPREHAWDRRPRLVYPASYTARSIEGWAMVTFDVAPWGQIGNVHAWAAQPTADFGTAAEIMLRAATFRPGPGYVGCIERVRYVIGKPGMPKPADDAPPLPPPVVD